MTDVNDTSKLAALGYEPTPEGIRRFQSTFNRYAARPLKVNGRLDAHTRNALERALASRDVRALVQGENT